MSSIRGIAERIQRIISGGNTPRDSQFHDLDVQYLVRDTAAKLIKGEWFAERTEGGKDIDARYVVPFYGLTVLVDSDTGENYIEMPVDEYIRLPYGAGIRSIRPASSGTKTKRTKQVETRAFIPIPNRFEDIYWQLPAGSLEGIYGWMLRKDKVYFTKRYDKTLLEYDISKVTMDVVSADPKAIDIEDNLPLSSEMVQLLIVEVTQILTQGAPEVVDQINDNNPNITRRE